MPGPRFVQFRVYAGPRDGTGLFVYARIFATRGEMLATLRAEGGRYSNKTDGVMLSYKRTHHYTDGSSRTMPCLGTVNLYRGRLTVEVVVHEFGHAMFAWAWRKGLIAGLSAMAVEEQACYVLGRMASRFVARAYELGLYEE